MRTPKGQLVTRTLIMSVDTSPQGDVFGGWILSQMDKGAGILALQYSRSRCATVAIDSLKFSLPVHVGEVLSCYAEIFEVGRSSMKIKMEAWRLKQETQQQDLVTEGVFTFVALNEHHKPHQADPKRRLMEAQAKS
ncbi:MAG TPA: acyl-CoA thioesterase [Coxiellaceae bacterium]|nr:acyl-CoA thioesterase [Coxiellaceae bacterium]